MAGVSVARASVALRVAGASFDEIAEVLGLPDAGAARSAVERGLAAERVDDADRSRLRAEEEARLLALLRGLWGKALDEENPEQVAAARAALAVVDRHARLMGLDAPVEVVVHSPSAAEIDVWVAEVLQMSAERFGVSGEVLAIE